MRVASVLSGACLVWCAAGDSVLAQAPPAPYGYVVRIPDGSNWWLASPDNPKPIQIAVGTVLLPGARPRAVAPTPDPLRVLEYATGRIVSLPSDRPVPAAGPPPQQSGWTRLMDAIARRLSNERLSEGVVRARPRLQDAARVTPGSQPWSSIVVDLPPGTYRARFRRLGGDGTPSAWTASIDVTVAASGFTPATFGTDLGPGLWQASIRHRESPSIGGDAWLLLTKDANAVRQFDELSRMLAGANQDDAQIAESTTRVRRAALLALAP